MSEHKFITFRADEATKEQKLLLKEYYALRQQAFQAAWGRSAYTKEATEFDEKADTVFVFLLKEEIVASGGRIVSSKQGKLPLEKDAKQWNIENVLPHLDSSTLNYAELGGVVTSPKYRGEKLSFQLCKKACDIAKNLDLDFLISTSNELVIKNTIKAAEESGYKTIVRPDTARHDALLKSTPMIVMRSIDPEFPFLSESMKKRGVGISGADYLEQLKKPPTGRQL